MASRGRRARLAPLAGRPRASDASSLGLNGSKWTALVGQRTHLDMYRYALRESPLLRKANTTRFVDKVPGYRENLEAVLRRAPGVPVVFVFKTRASAYKSYVTHRHMDEGAFNRTWDAFMRRLDDARRHPRVRAVSYEALMEARDPEVVRGLFDFVGLPDFWPDAVWKSTSVSGAPDNSSLSHFSAMTRLSWLRQAVMNRHCHAIEQEPRRWRGGRRDDS